MSSLKTFFAQGMRIGDYITACDDLKGDWIDAGAVYQVGEPDSNGVYRLRDHVGVKGFEPAPGSLLVDEYTTLWQSWSKTFSPK
jgi:hypothetical protein